MSAFESNNSFKDGNIATLNSPEIIESTEDDDPPLEEPSENEGSLVV